jgi:uncharacterized membrane protein
VDLPNYFLLLVFLSTLGWTCETIYIFITTGKLAERGFLRGPVCPIYGIGGFILLLLCGNPVFTPFGLCRVALYAIAVCLAGQIVGPLTLERVFGLRFWDGLIISLRRKDWGCLKETALLSALGALTALWISPFMMSQIRVIPLTSRAVMSIFFAIAAVIDVSFSAVESTELRHCLRKVAKKDEIRGINPRLLKGMVRLLSAFPRLSFPQSPMALTSLREILKSESAGASDNLAAGPRKTRSHGRFLLNLFWTFALWNVLGTIIELLYCYGSKGLIESRSGLLYGWQNPVYGGAAFIVTALFAERRASDFSLFYGCVIIGGTFEYVCSLGQQLFFGSISWKYNDSLGLFGGRTCLAYAFSWGFLGLFWVRGLYPVFARGLDRLAQKPLQVITRTCLLALCLDITITALAVSRWSQRIQGEAPANAMDAWLDKAYTDDELKAIYPHMRFLGGSQTIQPK